MRSRRELGVEATDEAMQFTPDELTEAIEQEPDQRAKLSTL